MDMEKENRPRIILSNNGPFSRGHDYTVRPDGSVKASYIDSDGDRTGLIVNDPRNIRINVSGVNLRKEPMAPEQEREVRKLVSGLMDKYRVVGPFVVGGEGARKLYDGELYGETVMDTIDRRKAA